MIATEPKIKTTTKTYDKLTLTFKSESWDGIRYLDTEVKLNGAYICWICFDDIEAFSEKFFAPIKEYRI